MSPKAINVPPPITPEIDEGVTKTVEITEARIVRDQWTSIGTLALGLGINIEFDDETYSALFSLDKEILAGSIGRILTSIDITEFDKDISDEHVAPLIGKKLKVTKKKGKLYWYP